MADRFEKNDGSGNWLYTIEVLTGGAGVKDCEVTVGSDAYGTTDANGLFQFRYKQEKIYVPIQVISADGKMSTGGTQQMAADGATVVFEI